MGSNDLPYDVSDCKVGDLPDLFSKINLEAGRSGKTQHLTINDKHVISLIPNPTKNQPGNAMILINGEAPSWNDLRPAMENGKEFKKEYQQFQGEPLGQSFINNKAQQAGIISKFEIARRVETSGYPTQGMIEKGIERAVNSEQPEKMMDMFRGEPQERVRACKQLSRFASFFYC